jgi:hypothetical protein
MAHWKITLKANFGQWFGLLRGKAKPNVVEMRFWIGQVGDLPHGKFTFKANFRQWFGLLRGKAKPIVIEDALSAWAGREPAPRRSRAAAKAPPEKAAAGRIACPTTGETACPTKKRATKSRSCNAENYVQSQFLG